MRLFEDGRLMGAAVVLGVVLVGSGSDAETWRWLGRGVVDGLVVACSGAFYLGFQQRRRR